MQQVKVGTITGNGAAQNIEIGFIPDYVKVVNATDGDVIHEWFRGMGAADAIKHNKIADNGATGASSFELITSNGIDTYSTDDNEAGFTISAAISENAKTLYYLAIRSGE